MFSTGRSIFREKALERLSSPDQLDRLMPVSAPRDTLILAVAGLLVLLAASWAVFGRVPTRVSGRGVLLPPQPGQTALMSVAYFSLDDGQRIEPGMPVLLALDNVDKSRFGDIVGTVESVSPEPVSRSRVLAAAREAQARQGAAQDSDDELALSLPPGPVFEVRATLAQDPSNFSGYRWSSSKGPHLKIYPGLTNSSGVTVDRRAPITYLLPFLRETAGAH